MNATDVLHWGHDFVERTIAGLPEDEWDTPNVCGVWSCKEIMGHLASFEHLLVEVLCAFLGGGPTPYLDEMGAAGGEQFNAIEVGRRRDWTVEEVLAEYRDAQAETMGLVRRIPAEVLRQPGTLPWYGAEFSLDDYLVYQYYGHKREHMAQINIFRDLLKAQGKL
jgi:hypothetical protein